MDMRIDVAAGYGWYTVSKVIGVSVSVDGSEINDRLNEYFLLGVE